MEPLKSYQPGVYLLENDITLDELSAQTMEVDFKIFHIIGKTISNESDFFVACRKIMAFPFFGYNWDALEDCLCDMSWHTAKGYVLLYSQFEDFASNDKRSFQEALEIFQYISSFRRDKEIEPFYILLKGDKSLLPDIIPIYPNKPPEDSL